MVSNRNEVSIPLEQGGVFRRFEQPCSKETKVSIPLEQGGVFRLMYALKVKNQNSLNPFGTGRGLSTRKKITMPEKIWGLNPFGTGRGLSTVDLRFIYKIQKVSIPLEQGGVFRLQGWFGALVDKA